MKKEINIYIGIDYDKNNKKLTNEQLSKLDSFESYLCLVAGGFTKTVTSGGYKASNGQLVLEQALKYEVLTSDLKTQLQILDGVKTIKEQLNQESILVTIKTIDSINFIN